MQDIPKPSSTKPTITSGRVLKGNKTFYVDTFVFALIFYVPSTYSLNGKNGAGPTKKTLRIINIDPRRIITFGLNFLSHNIPTKGAVAAYVVPLIINMRPRMAGLNLNLNKRREIDLKYENNFLWKLTTINK